MDDLLKYYKGHSSAAARWARFGPYYAMFPIDFAFNVVNKYSKPGDKILDPFSVFLLVVFWDVKVQELKLIL